MCKFIFLFNMNNRGKIRQNQAFPVFDGETAKSRSVSVTASGGNSNLATGATHICFGSVGQSDNSFPKIRHSDENRNPAKQGSRFLSGFRLERE